MTLNLGEEDLKPLKIDVAVVGGISLVVLFVFAIYHFFIRIPAQEREFPTSIPHGFGTIYSVGEKLLSTYLLPFELASIVLLTAIIGAVVLAKRKF
jgi:NADH-quinone oxidoreductase subunit J